MKYKLSMSSNLKVDLFTPRISLFCFINFSEQIQLLSTMTCQLFKIILSKPQEHWLSQLIFVLHFISASVSTFHTTGSRCHKQRKLVAIKVLPVFYVGHQRPDISEFDLVVCSNTLFFSLPELYKYSRSSLTELGVLRLSLTWSDLDLSRAE